jgi:hypothetical protein
LLLRYWVRISSAAESSSGLTIPDGNASGDVSNGLGETAAIDQASLIRR